MTSGICKFCQSETSRSRISVCRSCWLNLVRYPELETEEKTQKEISKRRYVNRRNYVYRRKYGISEEQYQDMLENQGGHCAICKVHSSELNKRMSLDHDHRCCPGLSACDNCIRGLLCNRCNMALGGFRDSEELLELAMNYLSTNRKEYARD